MKDDSASLIDLSKNNKKKKLISSSSMKSTIQKAIVKLMEWEPNLKNPVGEVIDVLGDKGNNTTEMHAVLAEYGLPYKYPVDVEAAADHIDAGITPEEVAKRIDLRGVTTFTIDPRDAKDFVDALSFVIMLFVFCYFCKSNAFILISL